MKKIIIPLLVLTALCGCSSEGKSSPQSSEMTTTAATTSQTAAVSTESTVATTSATNDEEDFVWFKKGVYEVRIGERGNDTTCDKRFKGDFYCFLDETHGEVRNVYYGLKEKFTCEQKKDRIIFHTDVYKDGKYSYSSDYEKTPDLDEKGNVGWGGEFDRVTFLSVPDCDPDTFNAEDLIGDYFIGANVSTDFEERVLGKKAEEDEDYVWADRGVYEIQIKEKKTPDKPYDDRFRGEFYVFYDANHGEIRSAFDGVITTFTCIQKKHSITFHYTSEWENSAYAPGTEYDVIYTSDPGDKYADDLYYDENGNLTLALSSTSLNKLIRLPDADPDTFDAGDYKDNYVYNGDQPRTIGAYTASGKKTED